ncbi:hypothetical protein ASAC_0368 [Acidilobus saccharovorans 345-15]|uniref:Uncharacterized protein n=1 Tax=Acidilobus saccharovorans (strain DSM 16705 / JCM 18335 / VKM B-2471 / 345-15) TaxID=666510 RepID=D9Q0D7_ACIS3|nr:hypothetical protein [Acidilobus saccharovorans]ADL18775.1 hypothetical protein ASAC_0368 [Acidilobus saccharovorans 345-15]
MDFSTLLTIIRLTMIKESKRNALLSLIVQLAVAYFIAYGISLFSPQFLHNLWALDILIVTSLLLIVISADIVMRECIDSFINVFLKSMNKEMNKEEFREGFFNALNVLKDPNNIGKLDDLLNEYFVRGDFFKEYKEEVKRRKSCSILARIDANLAYTLLLPAVFGNLAYALLLPIVFILINNLHQGIFSNVDIRVLIILVGITAYSLFVRNKIIASREKEYQSRYEEIIVSYISSLLLEQIINSRYIKIKNRYNRVLHLLLTYVGVPLNMYTVFNSLSDSGDNTTNSQETTTASLIYIIDEKVLNKSYLGRPQSKNEKEDVDEKRLKIEEDIMSFLSLAKEALGAKSLMMMDKREFTEFVCRLAEEAGMRKESPFNDLCNDSGNKDNNYNETKNNENKDLIPYDIGEIEMSAPPYIPLPSPYIPYINSIYKLQKLLRISETNDALKPPHSIIFLIREGKSVSVNLLIMLRATLSIKDKIIDPKDLALSDTKDQSSKKCRAKCKIKPVDYSYDLNFAIFLS